jgi:DNA invertase Pin-like site-specific DNA recombinase
MNAKPQTISKVSAAQQAKLAYVYIRQSSLSQVVRHGESTELQYRLVERAVELGWPRERVQIIDDDLGKSGASSDERYGFQSLIAEVGLGRVGLVLSFDASRLARNNSDWYRLIDLCALFGVLIADGEQLYDPRLYHDRLLLGLSGMMSEAELYHIKQRMHAGARHKAERGELRHPLPVGLVRQRDGSVIFNPDEEVQARLRLIFAKFAELGSARAVREYLLRQQLLIPVRPPRGPAPHETLWSPPRTSTLLRILHNPAYAGAYVHGQRTTDPSLAKTGRRRGIVELPVEQWAVCLQNVYPAYLSWETYLANRARLQANCSTSLKESPGVPRQGKALLQGIVVCGRCARHMSVGYSGPRGDYPVYRCSADAREYGGPSCQEVRGPGLDAAVEQLVLEALAPERIALALDALEQLELEVEALEKQWRLRLERVRFEAQRAQRQYDTVEPGNRLVARSLESSWEEKLRVVEAVEQEYDNWQRENHAEISAQDRAEILAIGEDLPGVWHAPTTTPVDRKHLLRLVVKEVIVDRKRQQGKLWFQINWQTGASTVHEIVRHGVSYREYSDGEQIEKRIRRLHSAQKTDKQIAATLNAEAYRTTYGEPFRPQNVWHLRKRWGLPSVKSGDMTADRLRWNDGSYTLRGVMDAVGVGKATVQRWLKQGHIQAMQLGPYMLWRFRLTPEQIRTLRAQKPQRRVKPNRSSD